VVLAAQNVALVIAAVAAFIVVIPGVAQADSPGWLVFCPYHHSATDDPIVFPGVPGAAHLHDFFGSTTVNATSTVGSMEASTTTCGDPGDTAGYWTPALYSNGVKINPQGTSITGLRTRQEFYYRKVGTGPVTVPPEGFKMIAGTSTATSKTGKYGTEIYWGCHDNSTGKKLTPVNCTTGIITLHVQFPSCWDGVHLDTPDHKSHVAYPSSGVCPASNPVRIPRVIERFEYPLAPNGTANGTALPAGQITLATLNPDGTKSSQGSVYGAHADWWQTWNQARFAQLVQNCLNAQINCGTFG
jgi:hypothetical protein